VSDADVASGDVASVELANIYLTGHVGESLLDMWHIFVNGFWVFKIFNGVHGK
jgi:hypothetical protein